MKKLALLLAPLSFFCLQGQQPPSLSSFKHAGAFVAPIIEVKGKSFLVLGRESHGPSKGLFDAFGGSKDLADGDHPVVTAAREFFEETIADKTLGMTHAEIRQHIDLRKNNTMHVAALKNPQGTSRLVLYLTKFPAAAIASLKRNFPAALKKASHHTSREKDAIATVSLDAVIRAIAASPSNTGIKVMAHVTDHAGNRSIVSITLRPIFAKLLRGYALNLPAVTGKDPRIKFFTF